MNELTKKIHGIFRPKAALIAYECGEGYSRDSYLELRPINENGKMGAAVPVSYDFMNALVENYTADACGTPHGLVPENMLLCDTRRGHDRYVWWNAPRRRRMFFKDSLDIADGEFGVPGVVYDARSDRLSMYAFKGARPAWTANSTMRRSSTLRLHVCASATHRSTFRRTRRSQALSSAGSAVSG